MAPIDHAHTRSSSTTLIKRLLHASSDAAPALSPMDVHDHLLARAAPPKPDFKPSSSVVDPTTISNNGIFALFGLIGAGLVITSIWFFFWAKNGGFHFRKGDWSEYKSTVLRRKGPNGTTLSGATATTQLGGGSVVGSQGSMGNDDVGPSVSEKGGPSVGRAARAAASKTKEKKKNRKKTKPSNDPDVRAYRHEKAAKVGGFNRAPDGWVHDQSNTSRSGPADTESAPSEMAGNGPWGRGAIPNNDQPRTPRARQYSYHVGSEATFSVASDDSHRPLRASPQRPGEWSPASPSPAGTPRHSRQGSPTKRASAAPRSSARHSGRASMPGSYAEPLDFESRYQESEGDGSRGTKSYYHPLPGLGRNAGGAAGAGGFRRGGGGRRDSLSDSEG